MSGDGFFILHVAGALFFSWAVCTDIASAFVFSVPVTIGGGIMEDFVFRADDVVIVAVIDICMPWMTAFLTFWSGVCSRQYSSTGKDSFAYPWCFVSAVTICALVEPVD